jgi:hypothetical protein
MANDDIQPIDLASMSYLELEQLRDALRETNEEIREGRRRRAEAERLAGEEWDHQFHLRRGLSRDQYVRGIRSLDIEQQLERTENDE